MSIFVLAANENWICDRFAKEWSDHNPSLVTDNIYDADTIWVLADWCWNLIPKNLLEEKKVVVSIHHIVPNKFDKKRKDNFKNRDQYVNLYHVPCEKTKSQIESLTDKPIRVQPFWVNSELWFDLPKEECSLLRKKLLLDDSHFLVGSFQRDTEGHDLISPKLEKGPDLFCDAVEQLRDYYGEDGKEVRVLLSGWRRQYVMNRLDNMGVRYYYFELPPYELINKFYNILDLYVVAARYEGGPQAIVECAASRCPVISTDVGLASEILNQNSLFKPGKVLGATPDVEYAHNKVQEIMIPHGFNGFSDMFQQLS